MSIGVVKVFPVKGIAAAALIVAIFAVLSKIDYAIHGYGGYYPPPRQPFPITGSGNGQSAFHYFL